MTMFRGADAEAQARGAQNANLILSTVAFQLADRFQDDGSGRNYDVHYEQGRLGEISPDHPTRGSPKRRKN